MPFAETPIEMAKRHVKEGSERLARQERLIADLERTGLDELVADARAFLIEMREFQALAASDLMRIAAGGWRGGPD